MAGGIVNSCVLLSSCEKKALKNIYDAVMDEDTAQIQANLRDGIAPEGAKLITSAENRPQELRRRGRNHLRVSQAACNTDKFQFFLGNDKNGKQ